MFECTGTNTDTDMDAVADNHNDTEKNASRTDACMYESMCEWVCVYAYVRMLLFVYVLAHTRMYECVYVCMCVCCMYAFMYLCCSADVHAYTCAKRGGERDMWGMFGSHREWTRARQMSTAATRAVDC